jgi:hypothetical protein
MLALNILAICATDREIEIRPGTAIEAERTVGENCQKRSNQSSNVPIYSQTTHSISTARRKLNIAPYLQ